MKKIKNRYQAESHFCELYIDAGRILGVPEFGASENKESGLRVSTATIKAIHECEFSDPHFIGGPAIFNFAKSHDDVERIFLRAEPTAIELALALEKSHPEQARNFRLGLESLKSWLHENVDKWAT